MSELYKPKHNTEQEIDTAHIIDYPALVESIQLSTARLLNMQGAQEADSFAQILDDKNPEERERIVCEVGGRFDDELINFITVALVASRDRRIVILADAKEGINGSLPWQSRLEHHLQSLHDQGSLRNTNLTIERYAAEDLESLTQQAQALALEPTSST